MCCTVAFVCQVIECQVNPVLILVTGILYLLQS
ncbi:Uncharacterised protein [Escherichia coli]|nr:Uncharacterised protein [Escherichia coli]